MKTIYILLCVHLIACGSSAKAGYVKVEYPSGVEICTSKANECMQDISNKEVCEVWYEDCMNYMSKNHGWKKQDLF